jgi:tetratricopeptide (TPR) repeat protein
VRLSPKPAAEERYKPSLPAYEAYLRGRHHQFRLTPGSWEKAKECYEQAIALAPKFALAYAELAGLFNQTVVMGMRPPQEIVPLMRAYAEKALELDPSLPDAHAHLGWAAGFFDFDWKEADRRFALATARASVPPYGRLSYTNYLVALRRPLEALEQIRRAVEEDPLSAFYRSHLAFNLWLLGRDGEALRELHRALELDENHLNPYFSLAHYHAVRGAFNEALPFAEKCYLLNPHLQTSAGLLAGILVRTGNTVRADEIIAKLGPVVVFGVARGLTMFHLITGEIEKAADCCERRIEQRDGLLALSTAFPVYKPLRESPRWPKLAKMMNLPEGV